jgi:hypothetical protein
MCVLQTHTPRAGKSANEALGYDWAIVTQGAPKTRVLATGKCRTGDAFGSNQGACGCAWLANKA